MCGPTFLLVLWNKTTAFTTQLKESKVVLSAGQNCENASSRLYWRKVSRNSTISANEMSRKDAIRHFKNFILTQKAMKVATFTCISQETFCSEKCSKKRKWMKPVEVFFKYLIAVIHHQFLPRQETEDKYNSAFFLIKTWCHF